jgi:hypothetical protein
MVAASSGASPTRRAVARASRAQSRVGEIAADERASGQFEFEHRGGGAVRIGQSIQLTEYQRMRLGVSAEQPLDLRAEADDLGPWHGGLGRHERQDLVQGLAAALELAGHAEALGQHSQQHQPHRLLGGIGRQQPQRGPPPVGGRGRGGVHVGDSGFYKDVDGRLVAMAGGLLDVMGLNRGRSLARGQRGGGAGVRGEPPAAADSLVDDASQQRVPAAHAARGPQWTKQVALGKAVKRRKRFRQREIGRRRDQRRLGDVGHGTRHLKVDFGEAERGQFDLLDTVGKRGRQPGRRLPRPAGRHDHHAGPRRVPDQVVEQLQGRVVEQQHHPGLGGQLDQSGANCTVQLVALDIDRPVDVHGGQSVAQKYAERDVALELAGPSGHDEHAGGGGRGGELRQQPGLAHAGLAGHPDEPRGAETGGEQLAPQQIQFAPTAYERRPDDHGKHAIADRPLWYRWKE